MDTLAPLQQKIEVEIGDKKNYPIGIFGSFKKGNKIFLHSLRNFLNEKEYNARYSEDLQLEFPPKKDEEKYGYSRKLSELLIETSKIYVIFFFLEIAGDHETNQSASMELEILNQQKKKNVLIFIEDEYFKQSKSLFKGLKTQTSTLWSWQSFTRYDHYNTDLYEDDNIDSSAMQACYNFILEMRFGS